MPATVADMRAILRVLHYEDPLIRVTEVDGVSGQVVVGHHNAPLVARTACVAALASPADGSEAAVVRAVGDATASPAVLLFSTDRVEWWCPDGKEPAGGRLIDRQGGGARAIGPAWAHRLDPRSVQRARAPGRYPREYQLSLPGADFSELLPPVDRELLARHEARQADRLAEFIDRVLASISRHATLDTAEARHQAITLAFWIVASRILRDSGVASFEGIDYGRPADVFGRVKRHYQAALPNLSEHPDWQPGIAEACGLARTFWGLSAVTIGPEVLGRVNETVRISPEQRAALGAHSTPTFLVDYIVGGLAEYIRKLPLERRVFAEPACGHAGFLVAALRLLASDIPPGVDRHAFLRSRVRGQDLDAVSAEVARLSLTLADIPNPDGWLVQGAQDLFIASAVERLVEGAGVVLGNPPFEEFTTIERANLAHHGVVPRLASRSGEIFRRCVEAVAPGTLLGFVLPPGLMDSPASETIALRRRLLERADIIEITELPDGIFRIAGTASFTLLARVREVGESPAASWRFRRVAASDLHQFRTTGRTSTETVVLRRNMESNGVYALRVPEYDEVWSLRSWQRIGAAVQGRFGQGSSLNAGASARERDGLKSEDGTVIKHLHLGKGADRIAITALPAVTQTQLRPGAKPVWRHGRPSGAPRLVLNRARRSRHDWWLQAFIDPSGSQVCQDGFVVEEGRPPWDVRVLWAIVNSPFANAYMRSQSTENSISPGTFSRLPIPELSAEGGRVLRSAVDACFSLSPRRKSLELHRRMLRVDAIVHALYGLRARDEWAILGALEGRERPGVGPYPPFEGFDRRLPLYLQLGIDVPLPVEPQLPIAYSAEALFQPQEALHEELAALIDIPETDIRATQRREWVHHWLRALQVGELAFLPPAPSIPERLLADVATLRAARANPRP